MSVFASIIAICELIGFIKGEIQKTRKLEDKRSQIKKLKEKAEELKGKYEELQKAAQQEVIQLTEWESIFEDLYKIKDSSDNLRGLLDDMRERDSLTTSYKIACVKNFDKFILELDVSLDELKKKLTADIVSKLVDTAEESKNLINALDEMIKAYKNLSKLDINTTITKGLIKDLLPPYISALKANIGYIYDLGEQKYDPIR